MMKNFAEKTTYPLDISFNEKINNFFQDLKLPPLQVKITVLESNEYNRFIDTDSTASLRFGDREQKATDLVNTTQNPLYKIYLREINKSIDLAEAMRELLKVHFPGYQEPSIEAAASIFADAFRCYNKLYAAREKFFFLRLCTYDNNLFKLANILPK
jgi:hypothetical protein